MYGLQCIVDANMLYMLYDIFITKSIGAKKARNNTMQQSKNLIKAQVKTRFHVSHICVSLKAPHTPPCYAYIFS